MRLIKEIKSALLGRFNRVRRNLSRARHEVVAGQFEPYVARGRVLAPYVFDFHIEDETGKLWYDNSPNQWMPERQWCLNHIREGFTVLDCGAHHGMMTILFAKKTGPTGRVIAWEALPSNALVIEKNARLNNCSNIVVRPVGLGSTRKRVRFIHNLGNIVTVENVPEDSDASDTIDIVALDEDVPKGLTVDFVKIDVEGSDLDVLRGATSILSQRPILDLEVHNFLFKDRIEMLQSIVEILEKGRYSYEVLPEIFSDIVTVEGALDVRWLSQFDNPHVFCMPK